MSRKPMSRTFKASLATGAAVVLLAGVGGTFARWYDDAEVGTGTINAGQLSLTAEDVTYSEATQGTIAPADIGDFNMVPGDVVTINAVVTPILVGDNLAATLTADLATATGDLAEFVTTEVTVGGAANAVLTEANSGTPVNVAIEITLPFSTGGEPGDADDATDGTQAQLTTLDLGNLGLSLVQNDR